MKDPAEALCQKSYIETGLIHFIFFFRQQINEQCSNSSFLQLVGDKGVARREPAAAAPMYKDDKTGSALGDRENSLKPGGADTFFLRVLSHVF